MIPKYNNLSLALGVPGLLLRFAGPFLPPALGLKGPLALAFGSTLFVLGTVLLFAGFIFYAKSRGRSGLWALFAILGVIGIIVLACLKDREVPPPIDDPLHSCPSCQASYRLSEYEPDAPQILCSKCKTVLERT